MTGSSHLSPAWSSDIVLRCSAGRVLLEDIHGDVVEQILKPVCRTIQRFLVCSTFSLKGFHIPETSPSTFVEACMHVNRFNVSELRSKLSSKGFHVFGASLSIFGEPCIINDTAFLGTLHVFVKGFHIFGTSPSTLGEACMSNESTFLSTLHIVVKAVVPLSRYCNLIFL